MMRLPTVPEPWMRFGCIAAVTHLAQLITDHYRLSGLHDDAALFETRAQDDGVVAAG
jgi:hypothetical protein